MALIHFIPVSGLSQLAWGCLGSAMVWTEPKYPTDVPVYTPEDPYRDPVALLEHREAVARRKEIDVEKARVSKPLYLLAAAAAVRYGRGLQGIHLPNTSTNF